MPVVLDRLPADEAARMLSAVLRTRARALSNQSCATRMAYHADSQGFKQLLAQLDQVGQPQQRELTEEELDRQTEEFVNQVLQHIPMAAQNG